MQQDKANEIQLENTSHVTPTTNASQPTVKKQVAAQNGILSKPLSPEPKISLRQRLKHFTFAWFLTTMSTGGLAIALAETPHKFKGLHTIGLTIFLLNIALFIFFTTCISTRFILHPHHARKAILHPPESLFIASFWLSISVLIAGTQVYGITYGPAWPRLLHAVHAMYWLYAGFSLANCIAQYYVLISGSATRPVVFSPALFLPGYSAMLTGSVASFLAVPQQQQQQQQGPRRTLLILFSGLAFQGFGFMLSFVCVVFFVRGLLDKGFPCPALRPGLFIPVGCVAYTIVALMGLAEGIPEYGYFAAHPGAKETLRVLALVVSVFMWLFAAWIFCIALLANVSVLGKMPFSLTWWAFIFPNVGFMLSTSMIGKEVDSPAILWVASVMTTALVGIWLVAVVGCARAVWQGSIVWPGKDEDKDL